MRFALYSDHLKNSLDPIDLELFNLLGTKDIKIGYIPSTSDLSHKYYQQKVDHYKLYGIHQFMYFDLDQEFDESNLSELSTCNLIHLSGGDTVAFSKNIKKRHFDTFLIKYLKANGIVIGISAGAIIMTSSLSITRLDDTSGSSVDSCLTLNLVDYEFYPHYRDSDKSLLLDYSKNTKTDIVCCSDGNGLIYWDGVEKIIGTIHVFRKGKQIQ